MRAVDSGRRHGALAAHLHAHELGSIAFQSAMRESELAELPFLERRAGTEFDPAMVSALEEMMRGWEPHLLGHGGEPSAETDSAELEVRVERSETGFDADTEGNLVVR